MSTTTRSPVLAEFADRAVQLLEQLPEALYVSVRRDGSASGTRPMVYIAVADPDVLCRLAEVDPDDDEALVVHAAGFAWFGRADGARLLVHADNQPTGEPPDVVPGEVV